MYSVLKGKSQILKQDLGAYPDFYIIIGNLTTCLFRGKFHSLSQLPVNSNSRMKITNFMWN